MNKVGADGRNLTTSPLRIERIVGRFQVLGDPERIPVQQLAESQELDKRTRGGFDRLGPGLPRPFEGENQRRTGKPGPPASASGPLGLRLPLPAHEPAVLAEAVAEPQGPTFVHRIDDPRDGRTKRNRRDCSRPLRRRRVTRTRCQRPSGSGKCLSPSVNTMQTPDQLSSNSLGIRTICLSF